VRGEKWFIGRVVFGRITQEFNFNLSKRLEDANGRFLGVVVLSLYPAYFRDFYGSVGPDAAVVALVREDGALLARYPPPPEDLTTAQVPPGFIEQLRAAPNGSFQQRSTLQQRDVLYTYRRLTLPLYVVYGTSVADIERRWLALIGSYLPFALAALVGLGIFGWAAYQQARAVDRSESLLRDANLDLERRVKERTQDLAATNAALERSLAVKDVLMREIHHRVKNNLQVIASIIRLRSKRASPEAGALLTEILSRISAIGQIHNQLYNTDDLANIDLSAYLDALCQSLRENEPTAHAALTLDAERVVVHMDTAMPLALIVVELITNAYKHAFPGGRAGEIRVTLKRRGDVAELTVRDNGIGTPAAPESRGSLGLQLVRLLAQQADASVETRVENGTIVTIRFAIGDLAKTGDRPREPGALPTAMAR
jgi:two-component sensor histidine kinase